MPDKPNGDGYSYNFDRRLDRINDTITSMLDLMVKQDEVYARRHNEVMDEIREMLTLQRDIASTSWRCFKRVSN